MAQFWAMRSISVRVALAGLEIVRRPRFALRHSGGQASSKRGRGTIGRLARSLGNRRLTGNSADPQEVRHEHRSTFDHSRLRRSARGAIRGPCAASRATPAPTPPPATPCLLRPTPRRLTNPSAAPSATDAASPAAAVAQDPSAPLGSNANPIPQNSPTPPSQAAALTPGDPSVVSNGPVPDTKANRAKYGKPLSAAGRATQPAGN